MEIRNNIAIFLIACGSFINLSAQHTFQLIDSISWKSQQLTTNPLSAKEQEIWWFEAGILKKQNPHIVSYSKRIKLPSRGKIKVDFKEVDVIKFSTSNQQLLKEIQKDFQIYISYQKDRHEYYAGINFVPARKASYNFIHLLKTFTLQIEFTPTHTPRAKNFNPTLTSELADGTIYKMAIPGEGIYKIDYAFIQDSLNLIPSSIDPRNVKILSQDRGPLREALNEERIDDLSQLSIYVEGGSDGSFDPGDAIIFYAPGPHRFYYEESTDKYTIATNVYDHNNYVFFKISPEQGKRIQSEETGIPASYESKEYDAISRYEKNSRNLLGEFGFTQGTGQQWFGEIFTNEREQDFSEAFRLKNINLTKPVSLSCIFAGRSKVVSKVQLSIDGNNYEESMAPVATGDVEAQYARIANIDISTFISRSDPTITIRYPHVSTTSEGWLDFIQLTYRRKTIFDGEELHLKDRNSLDQTNSSFAISGISGDQMIWDVTQFDEVKNMKYTLDGGEARFSYTSDILREFIVFDPSSIEKIPSNPIVIDNQNIHGITEADFVIITHPEFLSAAEKLANHRESTTNFQVEVINVHQLYNEFSSGKIDPTAIRDFSKMIYDRSEKFKFLLLFGDASYDYRNVVPGLADQNYVPVYETYESLNPLSGFPTDDYFALLDDNEGGSLRGAIDIAVGRLPAKSLEEANNIVDKIISYEALNEDKGDWQLRIAFLADDEDSNIHLNQAENIATSVDGIHPLFNQEKIYFDAFNQVSTPGGARYPDANQAFNNAIFKGLLVANYLGHGGPKGWSQERVLKVEDIQSWENKGKFPLIITATCSFTGFDDAAIVTAGEEAILKKDAGAIALFSTVRSVFSSQNFRLTKSVFDFIFKKFDGDYLPIGEVIRRAKNANSADTTNINARKFLLIGDPSMSLAIPKYNITTSHINGKEITEGQSDTIRALDRVELEGFISNDNNEIQQNFNGTLSVSVFDKKNTVRTLSNDRNSPEKEFKTQKNVIFKGLASVTGGKFAISFVVPVDINYQFGEGKISYYAFNLNGDDAAGAYSGLTIGGSNSNALDDKIGPAVQVFMNNESFVSGGITDANPNLFVKISDENGINLSSTSIGHDIVAILDDDTQNTIILNDFYSASVDDFTSGVVKFPLRDIESGKHSILVKAFDVANNVGEGFTEFIVTDGTNSALSHVLNYPNPFTTSTAFSFEHDLPNALLDVSIDIYTVSGKLVKSIREEVFSDGFRIHNINWNGADDYGSALAKGIYLYKVKIFSTELNISRESAFEKLVILR